MVIIYQRIEDVKDQVILFRPVYSDEGSITEIFMIDDKGMQKTFDRRNIISVRQAFARCFALDLSAQAKDLQQKLNRKFPLPFYLPDSRVFIPLKMRKPLIIKDSTYGYVNISYIKSVRKINHEVVLTLTTNDKIPLYNTSSAAYNIINLGKGITDLVNNQMQNEQERILDALGILIDKLYRIEKILNKY